MLSAQGLAQLVGAAEGTQMCQEINITLFFFPLAHQSIYTQIFSSQASQ